MKRKLEIKYQLKNGYEFDNKYIRKTEAKNIYKCGWGYYQVHEKYFNCDLSLTIILKPLELY